MTGKRPVAHSPNTNECPLKKDYFSREYIFQPLSFGDMLVFWGVNLRNSPRSFLERIDTYWYKSNSAKYDEPYLAQMLNVWYVYLHSFTTKTTQM